MKLFKLSILILFIFSLFFCSKDVIKRDGEPDVFNVSEEDPEMNTAMQNARDTIDAFKDAFINPEPDQIYFSLKVKITDGADVEHMWLSDISFDDTYYYGKLGNEPVYVSNVKFGDDVKVPLENISDWMIIEDNKLIGGYTIRVLRDKMSPAERAEFDASFGVIIE